MILKNVESIVTFFDVAEEIEAESILDVGMFLKRSGCVSRMACGRRMDEKVRLTGVDILPTVQFPVWEHVYDRIVDVSDFLNTDDTSYDLAFVFGAAGVMHAISWKELTVKLSKCAKVVVSDYILDGWEAVFEGRSLQSEAGQYFLFQSKG